MRKESLFLLPVELVISVLAPYLLHNQLTIKQLQDRKGLEVSSLDSLLTGPSKEDLVFIILSPSILSHLLIHFLLPEN